MNSTTRSGTAPAAHAFDGLCAALRRQHADARISDMLETLERRGHAREAIVARVMQAVGPDAAVRVRRLASARAQQAATGTWRRYRMSRTRRLKLWLRGARERLEDAVARLRAGARTN